MAEKINIISLGGLNEIGKNMTAIEYAGEILIIDCGMGFPDDEMYGIDVVIPDVSYLVENQQRIRGLILTHGHEDHIGAIPYVLNQIQAPIYTTKLTAGLVNNKLEEHKMVNKVKIKTITAGQTVKIGKFSVEFIHVNHSIADAIAVAIKTSLGTIIHTGDFKIDTTPIDEDMIDLARFGQLGNEGVLALMADSTNVERDGYTPSEQTVGRSFENLVKDCKKRIIVTTFASNIHRVQQIIDCSIKYGRKICISGRSLENNVKVATELGYMHIPDGILMDPSQIKKLPPEKIVIITTGSQGENMSGLYRMTFSGHKQFEIGPNDRVIISASAIPGNEKTITRVIDELFHKGAEVINTSREGLHVSGHACREELKIMLALTKPKYFIPVHGEHRHLKVHADLAMEMGIPEKNIAVAEIGQIIEMTSRKIRINGSVQSGQILVDGEGLGDVGSVVLRDRKHLAEDGMIVVIVNVSGDDGSIISGPDIITRGFIYVKESEDLMEALKQNVLDTLWDCEKSGRKDWSGIKSAIKNNMSSFLFKNTKRNPMILPVVIEL